MLAYDEASGTTGYYPVTAVIVNLDPALLALTIDGQVVEATPGHPFYVVGHGWVNAGDLWVGAPIRHADGTTGTVQGIRLETRPQVMYNLTVAGAHTFFVGAQQVLVHNTGCFDPATGEEVGRFIVDPHGNAMIEPVGGSTVKAGSGNVDTHTLYPNGSNYQRLNPQGHGNNPTPHGHGHGPGTGTGKNGQGVSLDPLGNVVPYKSPDAHWTIK